MPLPKIGYWRPSTHELSSHLADLDKYDMVVCNNQALSVLRPRSTTQLLICDNNLPEMGVWSWTAPDHWAYESMTKISPAWILTGVGTVLTAPLTSGGLTVNVYTTTAGAINLFRDGGLVLCGTEIMRVATVGTNTLTLTARGVAARYQSAFAAVAHNTGDRIAPLMCSTSYADAFWMDVSTTCPAIQVEAGYGAERYCDFRARMLTKYFNTYPGWGGIWVDNAFFDMATAVTAYSHFTPTIDQFRTNVLQSSYYDYDQAWNAGVVACFDTLRANLGPDVVIIGNATPPEVRSINGYTFEGVCIGGMGTENWRRGVIQYSPHDRQVVPTEGQYGYAPESSWGKMETDWVAPSSGGTEGWSQARWTLGTMLLGGAAFMPSRTDSQHIMWMDEFDCAGTRDAGYLGEPLGIAQTVTPQNDDILGGAGAFDSLSGWTLYVGGSSSATLALDNGAAKVTVTTLAQWYGVRLRHSAHMESGKTYRITFKAKASSKVSVAFRFGLLADVSTPANVKRSCWHSFSCIIHPIETGTLDFWLHPEGTTWTGDLWVDDLEVREIVPEVWRRDYERGAVIVNSEATQQTVQLPYLMKHLGGTQDPVVNDNSLANSVTLGAYDAVVLLRIFTVERSSDDGVTWEAIGTSEDGSFDDTTAVPGTTYIYRLNDGVSVYESNPAVVKAGVRYDLFDSVLLLDLTEELGSGTDNGAGVDSGALVKVAPVGSGSDVGVGTDSGEIALADAIGYRLFDMVGTVWREELGSGVDYGEGQDFATMVSSFEVFGSGVDSGEGLDTGALSAAPSFTAQPTQARHPVVESRQKVTVPSIETAGSKHPVIERKKKR